jgi:hypothetical protein
MGGGRSLFKGILGFAQDRTLWRTQFKEAMDLSRDRLILELQRLRKPKPGLHSKRVPGELPT